MPKSKSKSNTLQNSLPSRESVRENLRMLEINILLTLKDDKHIEGVMENVYFFLKSLKIKR